MVLDKRKKILKYIVYPYRKLSESDKIIIIDFIKEDLEIELIAEEVKCSIYQVAAIKAHITMGTYD